MRATKQRLYSELFGMSWSKNHRRVWANDSGARDRSGRGVIAWAAGRCSSAVSALIRLASAIDRSSEVRLRPTADRAERLRAVPCQLAQRGAKPPGQAPDS